LKYFDKKRPLIAVFFYFCLQLNTFKYLRTLILIVILLGCSTENEIRQQLAPGERAAVQAHLSVSAAHLCFAELIQDYELSRYGLPSLAFTDSGLRFQHGRGNLRTDNINRSGICYLKQFVSSGPSMDSVTFLANTKDSFGILTAKGRKYLSGTASIKKLADGYFHFQYSFAIDSSSFSGYFTFTSEIRPGNIIASTYAKTWNGEMKNNDGLFTFTQCKTSAQGLHQIFYSGKAARKQDNLELNYDPFSNQALDLVLKVTKGRDEMLFDSW
jgi:hypothetical protein